MAHQLNEREESSMKKNVFVLGCNGKMGRIVRTLISESNDMAATTGFDQVQGGVITTYCPNDLSVCANTIFNGRDVIIDFSRPEATMKILPYTVQYRIPMVIATTGFTDDQEATIEGAARSIPIFKSSNMALSTKRFISLVKYAAALFPAPYEISIHEDHHSEKADAPSGTAKMLFDAINEGRGGTLVYRFDYNGKKAENEVWVSSGRVGSFRGDHIVTIAGKNDYVQLKHSISDRALFAEGALDAARFIMQQTEPRIYTMADMFNE